MSYSLEHPPGEAYFIVTIGEDYSLNDVDSLIADVMTILDNTNQPLTHIADVRNGNLSFDEIVQFTTQAALGDNPMLKHPNAKGLLVVAGSNFAASMTFQGLDSDVFGHIKSIVCADLDEAITYAKLP